MWLKNQFLTVSVSPQSPNMMAFDVVHSFDKLSRARLVFDMLFVGPFSRMTKTLFPFPNSQDVFTPVVTIK
jgi:hypothetical protein